MKKKQQIRFTPLTIALGLVGILFVGKVVLPSLLPDQTILGSSIYLARGGDDDSSGSSGSDNSGSGSSGGSSDSGSSDSNSGSSGGSSDSSISSSAVPESSPTNSINVIRTRTETKSEDETRTEVRLSEGERIRTRTKDGETRVDITSGGVKTRFEIKDDRMIIKAELEDGTEVELADNTLVKIEERLELSDIKIATAGAGRFVIQKGETGALTHFPLSIDLATNALTINTPAGQKVVTILPDEAVQGLLTANVVNRLGGQAIVDAAEAGTLTSVSQIITLGEQNDIPVYEIVGISDQNLLGFIPVEIDKNLLVSADTGEVISTQTSFGDRVLDLFSF